VVLLGCARERFDADVFQFFSGVGHRRGLGPYPVQVFDDFAGGHCRREKSVSAGHNPVVYYGFFSKVFAEVGGTFPGSLDWGLPFFFGRTVIIGYEGTASSLGSGFYWAY
jgi:hypothetical protein